MTIWNSENQGSFQTFCVFGVTYSSCCEGSPWSWLSRRDPWSWLSRRGPWSWLSRRGPVLRRFSWENCDMSERRHMLIAGSSESNPAIRSDVRDSYNCLIFNQITKLGIYPCYWKWQTINTNTRIMIPALLSWTNFTLNRKVSLWNMWSCH